MNWAHLSMLYDNMPDIQEMIYTTNAVESLNVSPQKMLKQRKVLPYDEAILNMLYLARHNVACNWRRQVDNLKQRLNQLSILFGEWMEV